jgi:protein-S-isoprenylcysteine O-methyltransferase Ste14
VLACASLCLPQGGGSAVPRKESRFARATRTELWRTLCAGARPGSRQRARELGVGHTFNIITCWTMRGMEMKRVRVVISAVVLTVAAVGQIILSFLLYNESGHVIIRNAGWVILWISAIFGWLPIFTFQKWGGVPKGKGYVHTTVLVDRGVYGIVRHPQYLAGILMGVGLSLIAQHWVVGVLGTVVAITSYADTFEEERALREKFGAEYEAYRGRVPRVNFVIGIERLLWRKRR